MAQIIPFRRKRQPGDSVPKSAWLSVKADYSRWLVTTGKLPDTRKSYVYNVGYFAGWMGGQGYPLISATSKHLDLFIDTQLEMLARSTAMNRLLACRSFYQFLIDARRRTTDPTAKIEVKRDKLVPKQPFSGAELADLVEAATKSPWREMLVLIRLFIGSGCRRKEIMTMQTYDIDWTRGRLLIHGKGSKERWVAPGPTAMQALTEYVGERQGDVWSISADTFYKRLRVIAKEASVVGAYPHRFRVTFAVNFYERYGNLAALRTILGHSSLRMSEHYASYNMAEGALEMQADLDLAQDFVENVPTLAPEPVSVDDLIEQGYSEHDILTAVREKMAAVASSAARIVWPAIDAGRAVEDAELATELASSVSGDRVRRSVKRRSLVDRKSA